MALIDDLLPLLIERGEINFIIPSGAGRSMTPTIVRGDRLHVRRHVEPPKIGEILVCKDVTGRFLIHRVVKVDPELRTRGDFLNQEDPEIREVLGIVYRIEKTWLSRLRRLIIRRLV